VIWEIICTYISWHDQKTKLYQLRRSKCSCLKHTLRRNDDSIAKKYYSGYRKTIKEDGDQRSGEKIWTAGLKYSWRKMEYDIIRHRWRLERDNWSLACIPLAATRL